MENNLVSNGDIQNVINEIEKISEHINQIKEYSINLTDTATRMTFIELNAFLSLDKIEKDIKEIKEILNNNKLAEDDYKRIIDTKNSFKIIDAEIKDLLSDIKKIERVLTMLEEIKNNLINFLENK